MQVRESYFITPDSSSFLHSFSVNRRRHVFSLFRIRHKCICQPTGFSLFLVLHNVEKKSSRKISKNYFLHLCKEYIDFLFLLSKICLSVCDHSVPSTDPWGHRLLVIRGQMEDWKWRGKEERERGWGNERDRKIQKRENDKKNAPVRGEGLLYRFRSTFPKCVHRDLQPLRGITPEKTILCWNPWMQHSKPILKKKERKKWLSQVPQTKLTITSLFFIGNPFGKKPLLPPLIKCMVAWMLTRVIVSCHSSSLNLNICILI